MAKNQTPNGIDSLNFKPTFRQALGNPSNATFHRKWNDGEIPEPDARIGKRPAWLTSTIEATVAKLVARGDMGLTYKPGKKGGA
ncbi:MAG: hypothetical protein ACLPXB_16285 [Thiobacillaceae bacterium]